MDEVSLGAATMVGELKDGEVREYEIHPEDFGLHDEVEPRPQGRPTPRSRRRWCWRRLANVEGTPREIVVLNAGAALYAAGVADSIAEGIERARAAIASGAAQRKLDAFVAVDAEARRAAQPRRLTAERTATSDQGDILARILDGQGRGGHRGAGRAAVRRRSTPRRAMHAAAARISQRALRAKIAARQARGDRRDQEGEPEQGRAARGLRSGRRSRRATSAAAPRACRC